MAPGARKTCDSCDALSVAAKAEQRVEGLSWKLNVILAGVASTIMILIGLVGWTVARVDQIEARAIDAAKTEASRVAWAVADERVKRP